MQIISGKLRNRKLIVPAGDITRPTSGGLREALFNICQHYVDGAHFLDLFAGSGAMGIEALSRGASSATFVDNNREPFRCIQQNIKNLELQHQTKVIYGNVFTVMQKLALEGKQFDIIFADPPYETLTTQKGENIYYSHRVIQLVDENHLLAPSGVLFVEDSLDVSNYALPLQSLQLKNSRRMGKSLLQQYTRT